MDYKILWLRERFSWMGSHSGYDQICKAITKVKAGNYASVCRELGKQPPKGTRRFLYWLARDAKASHLYDLSSIAAEVSTLWKSFLYNPNLIHITYVENNLGILPLYKPSHSWKLIGTAHQPASWWKLKHPHPESVCKLDALIVPASGQVNYFEQFLPDRVFFIPHGVNLEFFRPAFLENSDTSRAKKPRCVFVGVWLRDLKALAQVIELVLARNPHIHFDLVIPQSMRDNQLEFDRIALYDQVFWHSNITDEQLRNIYQNANVFIFPLLDCTANNALLEAMACGLPIVSNDLSGMRDYTAPSFSSLFPSGDIVGMVNEILNLVDDKEECLLRGAAARLHAEKNFSWDKIAIETLDIYKKVYRKEL